MRLLRVFGYALFVMLAVPCGANVSVKAKDSAQPASDDTVTWCSYDLPPMYIAYGPNAGKGIVDQHAAFLMRHLPEYQHRLQVSNIRRVTEQIRNHEHVVCAGMQKNPERAEYMSFSLPFLTASPPKLVFPRSSLERFKPYLNSAGEVRVSDLIDNSTLILGISAGRSYGRVVDEMLVNHPDHPRIMVRPATQDLAEGLIRMMLLKRIDYSIVFGSEYREYSAAYAKEGIDVASLPIEGQPRYVPVYIVAPRDAWGRQFIDRVNELLRTYWNDSDFRASMYNGMDATERDEAKHNIRELTPAAMTR